MTISKRDKKIYINMFLKRVERYEKNGLEVPSAYAISKHLGLSPQTLVLWLKEEGISFKVDPRGRNKKTNCIETDI